MGKGVCYKVAKNKNNIVFIIFCLLNEHPCLDKINLSKQHDILLSKVIFHSWIFSDLCDFE